MPLTNDTLYLFAVVRETTPGAADWTVIAEQDNAVTLQEVAMPSGGPWTWSPTELTGTFAGNPSIVVTPIGTDGRTAEVSCTGVSPINWRNGASGTFQVTLTDGDGNERGPYTILLNVRSLETIDFCVLEGQTQAGANTVHGAMAGESHSMSAVDGPPGSAVSFSPDGRINVSYGGDWSSVDGSFVLTIGNGSGIPSSVFDGTSTAGGPSLPSLMLRKLKGNGYSVFQNQTAGGDGISGASTESYSFSVTELPPGTSLNLDPRGAVSSASAVSWDGASDGTFELQVKYGHCPTSYFTGAQARSVEFRSIDPIQVDYDGTSTAVTVNGETGNPWDWQGCTESMGTTNVLASLGVSTTGMDIAVDTGDPVQPGDFGTATITLQKVNGSGDPLRPSSTVAVPISTKIAVRIPGTTDSHDLPGGRSRMRYQAGLEAVSNVESGTELVWSVDFGGDTDMADALSLIAGGSATQKVLETPFDGTSSTYLPNVGSVTTKTITIEVIKQDTASPYTARATSEPIPFTMVLSPSKARINTTVLLDRSGSMSGQHRWEAACSGAGNFAVLVKEAVDDGSEPHKLGVYWFTSTPGTVADAFVNGDGDSYSLNGGVALNDAANVGTTCATMSPAYCTALGSGMLLCRDELNTADTGVEEKVLLVLSDGMENRAPLTTEVFYNSGSGNYWGAPGVRIYPLALMTGGTWVERLEGIVGTTGGLPALDVKSINPWTSDTTHKINNWFITHFTDLYGFTQLVTPPDPALSRGKSAVEPVSVNLGQNKLVFFMTHDTPKPKEWSFDLELPGGAGAITPKTAATTDGIRYFETPMSKMYIVEFPIRLPGLEHCWAGDWQMRVTRTGKNTGHYGVGALAKQDIAADIQLLTGAAPMPGDTATVRAELKDPKGKPILDAKVRAEITSPGEWIGDRLTKTARKDPSVYRLLARSKSTVNADIDNSADKLWQHLQGRMRVKPGTAKTVTLKHVGKGVYTASFKLTAPGETNVDISCTGLRAAQRKDATVLKKAVLGATKANLELMAEGLRIREISAAKRRALSLFTASAMRAQKFVVQTRRTVKVGFLPDADNTVRYGFIEDANTLCLHVEPKDKAGRLLGPGFADLVKFITPAGTERAFDAVDMLDGTYELEIPMKAAKPVFSVSDGAVTAKKLSLTAAEVRKPVPMKNGRLPLDGFSVSILGKRLPLTVFAIAGNKKTKQAHFVTCSHVAKIADEHFEWFTDMKDVQAHGYDTCELCMPLILNTATKELHKPTCPRVSKIKRQNRKEVHALTASLKKRTDGCAYCMPETHTR